MIKFSEVKNKYTVDANEKSGDPLFMTQEERDKLDLLQDLSDAEIKSMYEANSNTNEFSDAEESKLANIAANANNYSHPSTHPNTMITGLGTASTINTGTASGNVPVLDGSGKLVSSVIPSLAIGDVHTVANITARNALTVQSGDVAVVDDTGSGEPGSYIYDGSTWQELKSPTGGAVDSVGGYTGIVTAAELKAAYESNTNTNEFSDAEQTKLAGISTSANNYSHPANHSPSIITQDASNRFVTDTEKSTWNGKMGNLSEDLTPELAGELRCGGNVISDVKLWNYSEAANTGTVSGAQNLDFSAVNNYVRTVTGATTFTITNPPATGAGSMTLILTQSTPASTISWGGTIHVDSATGPDLMVDGATFVLSFVTTQAGNPWYMFLAGKEMGAI